MKVNEIRFQFRLSSCCKHHGLLLNCAKGSVLGPEWRRQNKTRTNYLVAGEYFPVINWRNSSSVGSLPREIMLYM